MSTINTVRTTRITRIYSGEDGESHIEDLEIPLKELGGAIGALSELESATGVVFRETEGDYDYDFHNAPRRQYVVNLDAAVEIEVGDGTKRVLGRGKSCSRKTPPGGGTGAAP